MSKRDGLLNDKDGGLHEKEFSAFLHCSASTARNTISKMWDLEIIVPVTGRGKGKYKWNLAFQADNDLGPKCSKLQAVLVL